MLNNILVWVWNETMYLHSMVQGFEIKWVAHFFVITIFCNEIFWFCWSSKKNWDPGYSLKGNI